MMKKISPEKVNKAKKVVSDNDFRKHMKNSICSAAKAGVRAKRVSRPQRSYKKKVIALGALGVSLVAISAVLKGGWLK